MFCYNKVVLHKVELTRKIISHRCRVACLIVWGSAKKLLKEVRGQSTGPFPNRLKTRIMHTPDNRLHNLSAMHNWASLRKIIINLCVSHRAAINQKKHNPTLPLSLSLPLAHLLPLFMALKRCNNRRVRELWWGVFTPAAQSASRRSSFQTRLTSPIPGGTSPSPAVALRDVLYTLNVLPLLSCSCNVPSVWGGKRYLHLYSVFQHDSVTYSIFFYFIPLWECFSLAVRTVFVSPCS